MVRLLSRFADRLLKSELDAQKSTNHKLHRACKFHRDRANALSVNLKTQKTKLTALRKEVRIGRASTIVDGERLITIAATAEEWSHAADALLYGLSGWELPYELRFGGHTLRDICTTIEMAVADA